MNSFLFILLLSLFFLSFTPAPSLGCFSSGDPAAERNPEAAKLRRAEQSDNTVSSAEKGEPELEVEESFLKDYLKEFGHLTKDSGREGQQDRSAELSQGIKHFQEFMGFKPTGKVDLPMLARLGWKRCGNPDEAYSAPQIWERTTLFWSLDSPIGHDFPLPLQEMKYGVDYIDLELIRQAFTAWEIVIAIEFLEAAKPSEAQIIFGVEDEKTARVRGLHNGTSKTGLGIATSSSPPLSRIWLNKHENWSTFQTQEEGKIDIFLVLIHEIGHSLGLKHSGDEQSVMFPMFERPVGDQLPVISNDDVERLRALYESSEPLDHHDHHHVPPPAQQNPAALPPAKGDEKTPSSTGKCPRSISAAANVNPETLYIFHEGDTWLFKQGKLAGGPFPISEIFPDGPDEASVAFTAGRLTVLMKEHIVFGYEYDAKQNKFTRAKGFPKELHNRILFAPEAAFPIANGSVILIKDKVFATYNVESNTPHMLGNVDEFFPNLPEGLRAGFSASPDFSIYHMLTPEYAFLYDVRITRAVGSQSIGQFLGCDPQPSGSAGGSNLQPPPLGRAQQPQPIPLQPIRPPQQSQGGGQQQHLIPPTQQGQQQQPPIMVHGRGPPSARFWKRR